MNPHRIENSTLSQLHARAKQLALAELQLRERRLGTMHELPDDFLRVRDLAHFINNRMMVERLVEAATSISLRPTG